MKPILIFEHIESSNAGLFELFLLEHSIPFQVRKPNQGDSIPQSNELRNYSGLCFLGGIESVTEPTQAMLEEIELVRAARTEGIPIIGHCLGGQLISKALGGEVTKQNQDEFGWSTIFANDNLTSRDWLANMPDKLFVMQWHSDAFTVPPDAYRILSGEFCSNQAFVLENILAMQFHVEIGSEMIDHWAMDLVEKHPPVSVSVQSAEQILSEKAFNFEISRKLANRLYSKWVQNLI